LQIEITQEGKRIQINNISQLIVINIHKYFLRSCYAIVKLTCLFLKYLKATKNMLLTDEPTREADED
jgi:hypothetical protein